MVTVPGITADWPLLLVTVRSACGVTVLVSVAELLAGLVSTLPNVGVATAVLVSDPAGAFGLSVAVTSTVTVPPAAMVAGRFTLPVPLAAEQLEPAVAAQVQVAAAALKAAGRVSVIMVPTAVDGPALDTVSVYVVGVPGTRVVTPSVLATARSTRGVIVSESVAVALAGVGSTVPGPLVAVAVFTSRPGVAAGSRVAVTR